MEKVYRYPNRIVRFLVVIPVATIVFIFAAMMLSAGIQLEQLADRLVALGLGLLFLLFALWAVFDSFLHLIGVVKVVTGDRSLIIQNTFGKYCVPWEEIAEFGTYKRRYMRVYYVKTKQKGGRKIPVCVESLEDINGLIETIFQKAINARFLWIENVAMIPFTRRIVEAPWKSKSKMGP